MTPREALQAYDQIVETATKHSIEVLRSHGASSDEIEIALARLMAEYRTQRARSMAAIQSWPPRAGDARAAVRISIRPVPASWSLGLQSVCNERLYSL